MLFGQGAMTRPKLWTLGEAAVMLPKLLLLGDRL
jgi:hypothetical protein